MTNIAAERAALEAQHLDIITREKAGAVQSYTSDRTVDPVASWLFFHITVTTDPADTPSAEAAAWRTVERIGQERFGIGFSYNCGAMQSGRLYEGQPVTRRGAHTVNDKNVPGFPKSLNYGGRAIAIVQNVNDPVTDAQVDAIARWCAAMRRSPLARIDAPLYPHRMFSTKSCPGDRAMARLGEIRRLADKYTANGLDNEGFHLVEEQDKTILRNILRQELYGDDAAHSKGMTPIIRNEVRVVLAEMLGGDFESAVGDALRAAVGKTQKVDGKAAAQVRARAEEGALAALEAAGLYVPPTPPEA